MNVSDLLSRGVTQVLPDSQSLATVLTQRKIRVYLGIDPTGSLLTLGHSVVLRKLQQFADAGHQVILLIGNGTVRIGDPTGRDSTRPMLSDEEIIANFQNWRAQASKVLDFDKIEIRYNGDWLDKLTYADMVKLLAKTTVQQLIERDMFQDRLKQKLPIHGHEILYPLLQGYDSVAMDVDLEIGGTDQTFNMMMGRHLQKVYNNREKWVLTTPIINGTDGRKMSKSYGNFIALTENPIDMYGKLMKISDDMIIDYFKVLTDVPISTIDEYQAAINAGENPMPFKKILARTITTGLHTPEQAMDAERHFEQTVQGDQLPDTIPELVLSSDALAAMTTIDLLKKTNPEHSNSQLRRLLEQKAVSMLSGADNSQSSLLSSPTELIQVQSGDIIKVGKRGYTKIKVVAE